jgi:type II secretory pathway component PulF
MRLARWRFNATREDFYRETRLDITKLGLRNSETLVARVEKHRNRTKDRKQWTWPVYEVMLNRLRRGDDFATAMKPFVPHDEYTLLEISRTATGKDAVRRGFELAEVSASAKAVLRNAVSLEISYPVVLLVAIYAYSMLFGGMLFPDLVDLRPVEQWTEFGQIIYSIDTFNYEHWCLVGSAVIFLVFAYYKTLKTWTGRLRSQVDAVPFIYRNYRDLRAAVLIVSFAALFSSGVTFRNAIARLKQTADPWLRWHLDEMDRRLTQNPHRPMEAFNTGLFSVSIVDKVSDAASRDQFEEAITALGSEWLGEIVKAIQRNAKRVHFALLGVTGLMFLFICLGSYVATGLVAINAFGSMH